MIVLLMALAGGLGAAARFVVDGMVRERVRWAVPAGTLLVNLTGSFALGVVTGLVLGGAPSALATVLGTGFLGGYTTFSTASLETARLLEQRRWGAALLGGAGVLVAGVLLAAAGVAVGRSSA